MVGELNMRTCRPGEQYAPGGITVAEVKVAGTDQLHSHVAVPAVSCESIKE